MKPSVLFVLIIITLGIAGVAGNVFAEETTVETSADGFDDRFFGEGVLHIIVDNSNAEDDDAVEELQIDITAKPDSGHSSSESFMVPETTKSSGRFELFLVHVDATAVGPDDLDPINSAGVEGDRTCIADCAPFITFGPGGEIDIQSELYEEVTFEITADNVEAEASYTETDAVLELDRDSYGTTSYVYITIVDQDANLNPTERDEFIVDPDSDPNDDLFVLDGGTFENAITFRETGSNTAVFEGRYRLGESILADSEALSLTLFDKANYGATLAALENDSNNTYEIGFTVGNTDGTIDIRGGQQLVTFDPVIKTDKDTYVPGENVHVTIVDEDANINPDAADTIRLWASSGKSEVKLVALETGADTGIFETSIHLAEEIDTGAGAIAPGGSVTITYTDERPADYSEETRAGRNPEKDFVLEVDVQLPDKIGTEATDVSAPVTKNAAGRNGPYQVGSPVTISTSVANNNDEPQHFVALIEVRDNNGVTVFLALQGGMLEPTGMTDIGTLWQPEQTGAFEIRAFVFSSIIGGAVLSPVASSEITVT